MSTRGTRRPQTAAPVVPASVAEEALPQARQLTQSARNAAITARNTPRTPRPKPEVGTRISHPTRGIGSVTEHMEDGRVRVKFDDGDEHRYKPSSWHKLSAVRV